jgi:hypothetical protein
MLPPEVLALLRKWWPERPICYDTGIPQEQRWLFPGHREGGANHHPPASSQKTSIGTLPALLSP